MATMITVGNVINDDAFKRLMKASGFLRSMDVKVGIVGSKDSIRKDEPIQNAQIAAIQEFGSPVRNIPPRPFLVPALEANRAKCMNFLRNGLRDAFSGDDQAQKRSLSQCGAAIRDKAKDIIRTQDGFEPLSPRTIKARHRIGFKGTKALIHTGQLLNSITFQVTEDA